MNVQQNTLSGFMVSIRPVSEQPNLFTVSYVPRGLQQTRTPNGGAKRVPEYKAAVIIQENDLTIKWQKKPSFAELTQEEFDEDLRYRMDLMLKWLALLAELIVSVREWATDADWSTKVVEKPMEDTEIGTFRVPALLLQKELVKVLLEPIGRRGPGYEGLVDLYLMPQYDDIASVYYSNNRWNLHYQAPPESATANIREGKAKPLSKALFLKVLEEMRRHAQ
jgi:hypothetical protein